MTNDSLHLVRSTYVVMTSFSIDSIINSSVDGFNTLLTNVTAVFTNFLSLIITQENTITYADGVLSIYKNFLQFLYFDEFQLKLLKAFLIILLLNVVLIYISWRVYGKRICERFMKPGMMCHLFLYDFCGFPFTHQ